MIFTFQCVFHSYIFQDSDYNRRSVLFLCFRYSRTIKKTLAKDTALCVLYANRKSVIIIKCTLQNNTKHPHISPIKKSQLHKNSTSQKLFNLSLQFILSFVLVADRKHGRTQETSTGYTGHRTSEF